MQTKPDECDENDSLAIPNGEQLDESSSLNKVYSFVVKLLYLS